MMFKQNSNSEDEEEKYLESTESPKISACSSDN